MRRNKMRWLDGRAQPLASTDTLTPVLVPALDTGETSSLPTHGSAAIIVTHLHLLGEGSAAPLPFQPLVLIRTEPGLWSHFAPTFPSVPRPCC
jgi:hypothetical protein